MWCFSRGDRLCTFACHTSRSTSSKGHCCAPHDTDIPMATFSIRCLKQAGGVFAAHIVQDIPHLSYPSSPLNVILRSCRSITLLNCRFRLVTGCSTRGTSRHTKKKADLARMQKVCVLCSDRCPLATCQHSQHRTEPIARRSSRLYSNIATWTREGNLSRGVVYLKSRRRMLGIPKRIQ